MATALVNPYITINGSTALADDISECVLDVSVDELDDTAFGDTAKSRIGGLKDGSIKLKFNQDFAASGVDATMWALLGTVVTFAVRAASGAITTSNPEYSGSFLMNQWSPVNGGVGDLATVDVTFPITGAVSRATS